MNRKKNQVAEDLASIDYSLISTLSIDVNQQKYKRYLHTIFAKTNSYEAFIKSISNELIGRYEIEDWTFSFLNLPDKLVVLENFGTVNKVNCEYISQYLEEGFYDHDLLLHRAKLQNTHFFQSDVIDAVNRSEVASYDTTTYKNLYLNNIKNGFDEVCCIPVPSIFDDSRRLLTVTSRGLINHHNFKILVRNNINNLMTLAIAINDIGFRKYKAEFLKAMTEFKVTICSRPIRLLSTMVKKDITMAEAAQQMGITPNTAKNHLARLKSSLGATTVHGAYEQALKSQLIT
jgi:hypothetical protein